MMYMFTEKLRMINREFDLAFAARVAKLIVEEYEIRKQKKQKVKKTKFDGGSGFINNLIKEIEHVSS